MRELIERYKRTLGEARFWRMLVPSVGLFIIGLAANLYAIAYATESASNSATDIVLSNIPIFDVDGLFVYGTLFVAVISVLIVIYRPKQIPFSFLAIGLFWIIRSAFTSLTHLAPFESHYETSFGPSINQIFFAGDQFFSAHTGMPFVGAIVFWERPSIRYFFIGSSVFFGIIVLLGHLHYSIDVASAFFITYGIVHLAQWLFPKSYAYFHET